MRKKISQKLKEVRRDQGMLEQNLASQHTISTSQTNVIVELDISILLQKLQAGELNSLEVLRAYQTKVRNFLVSFECDIIHENLGFNTVVGFGDNYRTQLRHRIHRRG